MPAKIPYLLLDDIWTPEEMGQLLDLAKNISVYRTAAKDLTSSVEHMGLHQLRTL